MAVFKVFPFLLSTVLLYLKKKHRLRIGTNYLLISKDF